MNNDFVIYFDGGLKGDPGNAKLAVAAVVVSPDNGEILMESAVDAGDGTNDDVELRALSHAISLANLVGARRPLFVSDSEETVKQANGVWAMKGPTDSPRALEHSRCTTALMRFDRWKLKHVKREQNKRADWLVSKHLGHSRTSKKPPPAPVVEFEGDGNPGWKELPPSRPGKIAA